MPWLRQAIIEHGRPLHLGGQDAAGLEVRGQKTGTTGPGRANGGQLFVKRCSGSSDDVRVLICPYDRYIVSKGGEWGYSASQRYPYFFHQRPLPLPRPPPFFSLSFNTKPPRSMLLTKTYPEGKR